MKLVVLTYYLASYSTVQALQNNAKGDYICEKVYIFAILKMYPT